MLTDAIARQIRRWDGEATGGGEATDTPPDASVSRAFNFELFSDSPTPEQVGALCAHRAGDWVVYKAQAYSINANGVTKTVQMPCREECSETLAASHSSGVVQPRQAAVCFRSGSFAQLVPDVVSGTLDCGHIGTVGNGMPCLAVQYPPVFALDGDKWKVRRDDDYARKGGNGLGVSEAEVMYTLTTADRHAVAVCRDGH